MTIQWYPGHMLETKNLLKSAMTKTDAVLEILDARCPAASANPFVDKLCASKFRLKILNKNDLADTDKTKEWLDYFENTKKIPAVSICGTQKSQAFKALNTCISKIGRNRARKLKIMVMGIPNTGKSTVLNTLAGKKIAKTGNVPAITRHSQRTSLKNNIDIYDTPGILWPVIEPEERALKLAASGAISDTAIDYTQIAYFAFQFLQNAYPKLLMARYPFLEDAIHEDSAALLEKLARAKGCLKKGGEINRQKAGEILIRELRAGKIGKISFETPEDVFHD